MDKFLSSVKSSPLYQMLLNSDLTPKDLGEVIGKEFSSDSNIGSLARVGISYTDNEAIIKQFDDILYNTFDDYESDRNTSYRWVFALLYGILTEQEWHCNPQGTVSLAEVFNLIGVFSDAPSTKSIDNIARENDYFIKGYNVIVSMESSSFYDLLNREELLYPVNNLMLAYILIVCWKFKEDLYTSGFRTGITFNWLTAETYLPKYKDYDLYLYDFSNPAEHNIRCIIERTMSSQFMEYMYEMAGGTYKIPSVMVCSLAECIELGIFKSDNQLNPFKQVSRADFVSIFYKLATQMGKEVLLCSKNM